MEQNKIEKIGGFIVVGIMFALMVYTILGIFKDSNIKEKNNIKANIDFKILYPFDNIAEVKPQKNIIEKYKLGVSKVKNKIEGYTSTKLIGYEKFIELSYIYNDLVQYSLVSNSDDNARIKVKDGYLSRLVLKRDVTKASTKLIQFNKYLEDNKIDMIYIQAPYKISENHEISKIYHDYSDENTNSFLKNIEGKVNYIDLREKIKENGFDFLSLFYKTDHHWLPETGAWATREITNYINKNYDLNLESNNIGEEKFNTSVHKNMYLGSDGRYVSLKNAAPEDFSVITPKYDTDISVKIPDLGIEKSGTYEETLIDWSKVKYDNFYNISQYTAYVYGDRPLIEIHNNNVHNGKRILLIRDSFSEVVIPFFALENEYVSAIDLRHFDGSLKKYIIEYNPDLVIVMYNPNVIADLDNKNLPDNFKNIVNFWDFE